jgi:hypothetical protein
MLLTVPRRVLECACTTTNAWPFAMRFRRATAPWGLGQEAREGLAKAVWPGLRLVRHSPNE